jgi:hypothetical protein
VAGHRTEHWTDYFEILAGQPGSPALPLADVSPQTELILRRLGEAGPASLPCRAHLIGEARTGHMASIMFRPAALRHLPLERPDVVHIIGEASYLSTWQVLRWSRRRWPGVPVSLYAAQNVVIRFPPPFGWLERRAYESVTQAVPIPAALRYCGQRLRRRATIVRSASTRLHASSVFEPRRWLFNVACRLPEPTDPQDLLTATEQLDT